MPIRKDLRVFYGREWREVTRPRILARAGNCCERCQKPNRTVVETISGKIPARQYYWMFWRLPFCEAPGNSWFHQLGRPSAKMNQSTPQPMPESRYTHVVLTIAHLNHQAGDDRDDNLQALCQWCHLIHDRGHHFESRATRKDERRPLLQTSTLAASGDERSQ